MTGVHTDKPDTPRVRRVPSDRHGQSLRDIMGYHGREVVRTMTDLLIRDVPDDIVAAIDSNAGRLGLSRSEYLRRTLAQAAHKVGVVTVADLTRFQNTFADLADEDVMRQAWQ